MNHQVTEELERLVALAPADPRHQWTQDASSTEFRRQLHHRTPAITDTEGPSQDERFRVAVPMSGGLDSSTAYEMARTAGMPTVAYYVDTGAPYSRIERAKLDERQIAYTAVNCDVEYFSDGVIDYGRNAVILYTVAEEMRIHHWWGEIWFGGYAGPGGEAPMRYGDKSHRFLLSFNHLLAARHDVQVCRPLAGMTKADMVAWWMSHDKLPEALRTFSCFEPQHDPLIRWTTSDVGSQRCGHCIACFKWWAAFAANGYALHKDRQLFPQPPRFPHEYLSMFKIEGAMEFAPGRLDWIREALDNWGEEVFAP
jgi:7-cyano-7-deazaguanine synthase in queuosine biosynthesis